MDGFAVGQYAAPGADEDAEARLLEDVHVVVVGVAHRPAGRVPLSLFAVGRIDQPAVAVRPLLEAVEFVHLRHRAPIKTAVH